MSVTSAEARPTVHHIDVPDLDPRIHVFRCLDFVDSFAIVAEPYLVVVDTLVSPDAAGQVMAHLEASVDGFERLQLLVVNTHGDWDHTWGNALFDGPNAVRPAPIIGHNATDGRFDREKADSFLRESQARHSTWYEAVEFRLPTVTFDSTLEIRGRDLTIRLVPTPGHTLDHVCIWLPEVATLLAGDAAEMPMPYVDDPDTLPALRLSLRDMLDLEPRTVLYCHAAGRSDPGVIKENVAYFDEAERRIGLFLSEHPDLDAERVNAAELAWPLEEALPAGVKPDDLFSAEFYRDSHDRALRAMARWFWSRTAASDGTPGGTRTPGL